MEPLILHNSLQFDSNSEELELFISSQIASYMLFPENEAIKSRSFYMTLCLQKIHNMLLDKNLDDANQTFNWMTSRVFGSLQNYNANLAQVAFPSKGKGSIPERAWKGHIAGEVFGKAFHEEISLQEAARIVSADITKTMHQEGITDMLQPTAENIMRNYWTQFKEVAHFWAAMLYFKMPEVNDSIIRLDKAQVFHSNLGIGNGWRGVVDVAHRLLEESYSKKRYKTHKPLLNYNDAFRIIFDDEVV